MELKANCKINLGLRILRRRADGFHDIETVMIPVPGLFDTVSMEALDTAGTFAPATPLPYPSPRPVFVTSSVLQLSGDPVDCEPEQNICMRALRLMQHSFGIGEAVVRLHKNIPAGAGLGGGSSDAAMVLRAVNREFALELTDAELERLAAELGSDVPFFIRNSPQLCTGRGKIMSPISLEISGKWLAIVKPDVGVSTAEAYAGATPCGEAGLSLPDVVRRSVEEWRELLRNDFEVSVFARHPEIAAVKRLMYDSGAVYASMSGSGSAVFGIFDHRPNLSSFRVSANGRETKNFVYICGI